MYGRKAKRRASHANACALVDRPTHPLLSIFNCLAIDPFGAHM